MPDPVVIPREHHPISRRDIDPDALRVLYRLRESNHTAYLVGGSVRDLILGRRPKDFDIGTDAHPFQIKRLFRNCWIIGRRFRLAHIKFGTKTIEVATFRKNISADAAEATEGAEPEQTEAVEPTVIAHGHGFVHRDNTFGTPEEDAFRRDFTVNALFYDVATRSVIDYVGGLADIERRVIRSIGDPRVRFVEDPVRMFRAAVLGARLGLDLDTLVVEAIAELRPLIAKASPARLLEEYFKILRSGAAEPSFRALARVRLLELMSPELKSAPESLWDSLARLDRYRQRSSSLPPELTNAVLIGSLLHPIGALKTAGPDRGTLGARHSDQAGAAPERDDKVSLGAMPIPRRDVDRLRQVMPMLPRLMDPQLPPRVARSLPHRPGFADAVTWLEVFGDDPSAVEPWKALREAHPQRADAGARKRRRRGRGRGRGPAGAGPQGHHAHPQSHAHPPHHTPPHHSSHSHGHAAQGDGQTPRRRRRRRRRRGPKSAE